MPLTSPQWIPQINFFEAMAWFRWSLRIEIGQPGPTDNPHTENVSDAGTHRDNDDIEHSHPSGNEDIEIEQDEDECKRKRQPQKHPGMCRLWMEFLPRKFDERKQHESPTADDQAREKREHNQIMLNHR